MDPYRNDPFDPFAGGPGDPMEQVLSLQTYSTGTVGIGECKSNVSCNSDQSCASFASGDGGSSSSQQEQEAAGLGSYTFG